MGKYLKEFELTSQYEEYINSTMALLPNVSLTNDDNMVHYNPYIIRNYLRFTAVEDSVIKLTGMNGNTGESATDADIQYSMDGKNWIQYDYVGIPLAAGETLYMKGNNPNGLSIMDYDAGIGIGYTFGDPTDSGNGSTGKFECHGNIMSLIYGDDFEGKYTIPSTGCFFGLFMGCTGLITAPELPATTLTNDCYMGMFIGCTSLETAPELPATTLAERCYDGMFLSCTSLNNITMLATDISAEDCLHEWVQNVSSTGTFVKHPDMTSLPIGVDGIPYGWIVQDNPVFGYNYEDEYFTIENIDSNNGTLQIDINDEYHTSIENLSYNVDNSGWNNISSDSNITVTVPAGKTIQFKCNHIGGIDSTSYVALKIYKNIDFNYNVYGNIMSLIEGDNFKSASKDLTEYGDCIFKYFFNNDTYLISAKNLILPATTLASYCYDAMFSGCTSLTTAPALYATTLGYGCYAGMFEGCTSLTTAPALYATTLANACYGSMFQGCTSLTTAPVLPATTLANGCYSGMFDGCTGLTTAPELPATTLADRCYYEMFNGCTGLTTAPELPATTLADSCYYGMFSDCTSLTTAPELPATTLVWCCYSNMFQGCTSLSYVKMLATDISAYACLSNWVNGVASTGTFVKHPNMTSLPTGVNGIPSGWTVQNAA